MTVRGAGFVLPGPDGVCTDTAGFWPIVRDGVCCLSELDVPDLPLRIAGQVRGWDPVAALGISERTAGRTARAALLAAGAVRGALDDAGLTAAELDDDRTVLIVASLQFAFAETARYHEKLARGGVAAVGLDYWMTGTPPSVVGTVASMLGIDCPTLSLASSCNAPLRALDVACSLMRAGDADRVILVGVDSTIDPVFVAGSVYTSRQGYRASSLSADPGSVRPHDAVQEGNATGEGAIAVLLEAGQGPGLRCRLHLRSSRSNGASVVATGPPDNLVRDLVHVLESAGRELADVGFLNTYADGNRFVEDHFCQMLESAQHKLGPAGSLLLTNQEAAFGHIAGVGGLVKLLASLLMLRHGTAGPVIGCRTPYDRLPATPVIGGSRPIDADAAIAVSAGAGGDATTALIEYLGDGHA